MLALAAGSVLAAPDATIAYMVEGDAIGGPLAPPGDASRGRDVVQGRDANCLLCHAVPGAAARLTGDLAPSLAGIGSRLSEGQLRLRLVDSRRLNPNTIMPSYYRTDGLNQVGAAWRDKPILTAQQIEDTVAYLRTLR